MSTDLILLHAPSVYDFRQKTILYGPVSDLIPPSPVFEMYPIGLTSIAEYLEKAGYRVVALGALTPAGEFIKAAIETDAAAILVSSLYGQGELDCRGFRDHPRGLPRGLNSNCPLEQSVAAPHS